MTDQVKSVLKWLVAGLLVIGAVIVVIMYVLRGRKKDAAIASADMLEAWHKQDVTEKQKEIDKLKEDYNANNERIEELEKKLEVKKQKLGQAYEDVGLTAEEIAERFSRINL
jgi:peptidoglycan hydrolase CwlO-like protein